MKRRSTVALWDKKSFQNRPFTKDFKRGTAIQAISEQSLADASGFEGFGSCFYPVSFPCSAIRP
jgi:hypothetical protein